MTTRTISKESIVSVNTLFTVDDPIKTDQLAPNLVHNFVHIVSLDGLGDPVTPASGSYSIFVKPSKDNGFQSITDNGTIDATLTGGNSSADGVAISASYSSNSHEVKVVPDSIVGAVSYRVTIRQNLT